MSSDGDNSIHANVPPVSAITLLQMGLGTIQATEFDKIHPVYKRDVSKILTMVRLIDLFTPEEVDVIDYILKSFLQPRHNWYKCLCYKEGNNVLGFACYAPAAITIGTFDILWMAVSPTSQGKGVGGTMLRYIEQALQKQDARLIGIETSSQKKYAQTRKFYEKNGYKRVAYIRDYYSPGDGKVVYAKYFLASNCQTSPAQSLVPVPA